MANYKADLRDINFNLFEVLQCQKHQAEMEVDDLKTIIEEYNKFVANEIYPCREEGDHVGVKLENEKVTRTKWVIKLNGLEGIIQKLKENHHKLPQ